MTALDKAKRIVELSQRHKDEPVLICYGDAPEIAKLFIEAVELLSTYHSANYETWVDKKSEFLRIIE